MKIEPRGKYAGVKVHLDGPESTALLTYFAGDLPKKDFPADFARKLGKKIQRLQTEHPRLLEDRTDEEIEAALKKESEAATAKLEKLKKGEKWNA